MTKDEFKTKVLPVIKRIAEARGYGAYYKAIAAQAACESNYGKSTLSSKWFNYFGMKAAKSYKGQVVDMTTKEEYVKGELTTIKATFRAYANLEAGINGYFDFIESYKRYQNLKKATSNEDYIEKLKADGWATSSTYVSTLTSIMKGMFGNENSVVVPVVQSDLSGSDELRRVALDVIRGKYGNGSVRRLRGFTRERKRTFLFRRKVLMYLQRKSIANTS